MGDLALGEERDPLRVLELLTFQAGARRWLGWLLTLCRPFLCSLCFCFPFSLPTQRIDKESKRRGCFFSSIASQSTFLFFSHLCFPLALLHPSSRLIPRTLVLAAPKSPVADFRSCLGQPAALSTYSLCLCAFVKTSIFTQRQQHDDLIFCDCPPVRNHIHVIYTRAPCRRLCRKSRCVSFCVGGDVTARLCPLGGGGDTATQLAAAVATNE